MTAPAPFWVNVWGGHERRASDLPVSEYGHHASRRDAEASARVIANLSGVHLPPLYRIKVTPKPQAVQP